LEVSFGGGEPLLYPELVPLCEWLWRHTSLGISITSHGHYLTRNIADALKGRISSMRFSIDGCEPYYSQIRRRPLARLLHNIRNLSDAIPFGINAVVSPGHVGELRRVAELTIAIGALDLLIIPEHRDGNLLLNAREWQEVQETVELYKDRCQLTVTHTAAAHLNAEFLPIEQPADFIFAHISAGRALQLNSYTKTGIPIRDPERMHEYFLTLRDQEKIT
jgi:MoaA/NifB/PqqE/SkfB family radical SAM enzyme